MKEKRLENARICPKGDIEANWDKAIGFIPKDKEIIIYKADAAHPVARFKIGDGVTAVQDLNFSGADMVVIEKLVNEKGELLIEYVDNAVTTIIQILDNKLDKTGGLVGGDLSVQGNLNVTGTTTTKDTETILIKDNVIVANSDGNELLEEAGFAVKTGADAAYGIMYDPVGDGVKIGLGAFDENGKFNYTEGEDQFLATRDDEIADGNLVKWDDTEKKLVDAGNEYVKNTDYATDQKVGVVKNYYNKWTSGIEFLTDGFIRICKADNGRIAEKSSDTMPIVPSNQDYAWKMSAIDNKEEWTDDTTDEEGNVVKGDKTKARELIGAVGVNDYAKNYKAGITISADDSSLMNERLGTNGEIPYVPSTRLSFAVKRGLINGKITYTDEEKVSACETIGALPKVFNPNVSQSIIKISKDGEVTTNQITSALISSAVVERVGSGNIIVPETPTDNSFATSKKYVDDLFASISSPDLTEYAKLTDLSNDTYIAKATYNVTYYTLSAGLFKYDGGAEGGLFKSDRNTFRISSAGRSAIDSRSDDYYKDSQTVGINQCQPLVPATLDYFLFSGFTNSKIHKVLTNTAVEGLWNWETFVTDVVDGKFKLKGFRGSGAQKKEIEVTMYIKTNNTKREIWEINDSGADVRKIGELNNDNTFVVNISTLNRYFSDFIQYKYVPAENEGENDKIYTVNTRKKALDLLGVTKLIEDLQAQINELKAKLGE